MNLFTFREGKSYEEVIVFYFIGGFFERKEFAPLRSNFLPLRVSPYKKRFIIQGSKQEVIKAD